MHDDERDHDDKHEHDHDQDHDHGGSLPGRAWHVLSGAFGGHSHDPADQVDETMETNADGRRAR